jgi:hypothetical protein
MRRKRPARKKRDRDKRQDGRETEKITNGGEKGNPQGCIARERKENKRGGGLKRREKERERESINERGKYFNEGRESGARIVCGRARVAKGVVIYVEIELFNKIVC